MKRLLLVVFILFFLILPVAAIDYIEYPYYNATATQYWTTRYPWLAIDHNLATYWDGNIWGAPGYLRIDYGSGNASKINNYSFYIPTATAFTSWNFEGSNDTTTWSLLDSRSVALTAPAWFNYSVTKTANVSAYRYYQAYAITSPAEPIIGEFNLRYYDIESVTTNFTGTPTSGLAPLSVQFNDTSTSSFSLVVWEWDFTNDGIIDSREQNPLYVYPASGIYSVNLTASNIYRNASHTKTDYIHVGVPSVDFSGTPLLGPAPTLVTFTDLSTNTPTMWNWTFGDGNRSTLQNPTWTYTKSGTYNVSLVSGNAFGNGTIETKVAYVYILGANTMIVDFSCSPVEGLPGLYVKCNDLTIYGNASTSGRLFNWSFGDGGFSSNATISSHVYPYLGEFSVGLSVNNTANASLGYGVSIKPNYILISTNQNQQNTWWTPHTVQLTVMDVYGARLDDVLCNASYNESSMPTQWITDLYGIQSGPQSDMINKTLWMDGMTGGDGTITFTMLGSLKYDIYLTSAAYGLNNYHISAYPSDSMLNVYIQTNAQAPPTQLNNTYQQIGNRTKLYFTEPNISYGSMCIDYEDPTGLTSSVTETWKFAYPNQTTIRTLTFAPGITLSTNCVDLLNVRGIQTVWNYNATRVF
jgi:PKD repeat protein